MTNATRARLDSLLERTSRTFALTIPMLPEPRRTEVEIAYLLFRVADTFEDAEHWTRSERVGALERFVGMLDESARAEKHEADGASSAPRPDREVAADPTTAAPDGVADLVAQCSAHPPVDHAGYLDLLDALPVVLQAWRTLSGDAREIIGRHTVRTARGMADFTTRIDDEGVLRLADLDELRDYCYVVAGIVGEMLTELFLLGNVGAEGADDAERTRPAGDGTPGVAAQLRRRARFFGEGLQLVNVLKDARDDAAKGRVYLPADVERGRIFDLAFRDLRAATEYVLALQEADAADGIVASTALPVRLAIATLERVREQGPGSKISRLRVWRDTAAMRRAIAAGRTPVPTSGWPGADTPWTDDWAPGTGPGAGATVPSPTDPS